MPEAICEQIYLLGSNLSTVHRLNLRENSRLLSSSKGNSIETTRWLTGMKRIQIYIRVVTIIFAAMFASGCLGSSTLDAECMSNDDCDASWGEFCHLPQNCDPVEMAGRCKVKPTQGQCSEAPVYPVCGCDQQKYQSSCWAAQARQSIYYYGTCVAADTNETHTSLADFD